MLGGQGSNVRRLNYCRNRKYLNGCAMFYTAGHWSSAKEWSSQEVIEKINGFTSEQELSIQF